jgi:hypothetical protein
MDKQIQAPQTKPHSILAKFTCSFIQENEGSKTAHLYAVYSEDGENKDFAKATPGGNLSINIDNETAASGFFEQGKDYYLTFTETNPPTPPPPPPGTKP